MLYSIAFFAYLCFLLYSPVSILKLEDMKGMIAKEENRCKVLREQVQQVSDRCMAETGDVLFSLPTAISYQSLSVSVS